MVVVVVEKSSPVEGSAGFEDLRHAPENRDDNVDMILMDSVP